MPLGFYIEERVLGLSLTLTLTRFAFPLLLVHLSPSTWNSMKTRSKIIESSVVPLKESPSVSDGVELLAHARTTRPSMLPRLCDLPEEQLTQQLLQMSIERYGVPAKPLQLQTVVNLLKFRNTFVLAATGFGKTRIAELYYFAFGAASQGLVLVLNPLDALGFNQVTRQLIIL